VYPVRSYSSSKMLLELFFLIFQFWPTMVFKWQAKRNSGYCLTKCSFLLFYNSVITLLFKTQEFFCQGNTFEKTKGGEDEKTDSSFERWFSIYVKFVIPFRAIWTWNTRSECIQGIIFNQFEYIRIFLGLCIGSVVCYWEVCEACMSNEYLWNE